MDHYIISADATAEDLIPICLSIHEIVGRLPVTAKARNTPGVRIEEGVVIDRAYLGPVLDEVLSSNKVIKKTPKTGPYKGVPVIVAPVRDKSGDSIAAIGLVDITGIFDLATLMEHQTMILKQVCGKDPCPLPSEQINAKR
ncbi:DUF2111 domain-containing protein [Methanospirillum lacunae]|uniref:DUF2111 domain-containing protein n=1 Tax=Methanospirillum lacunae TaxID=668570 RepID=A0A2V2MYQ1_9EURY|nr:DUF2111 domain-containing protein [Methanospirillum lacunae]PWR70546.1 hypothetical protein DK846_14225 [Methanospirillum lacunae]